MNDPKNPTNIPEFDLDVYNVAVDLLQQEPEDAIEISIQAAKQINSDFIPLDEIEFDDD